MGALRRDRPIILHRPKVRGTRLTVRVDAGSASKYLRCGDLSASYSELSLADVPASVLVLPALGTVLTVAMAAGVPVQVSEVDAEFAEGVDAMAALWRTLHPRFRPSGFELRGERVDDTGRSAAEGDLLLWSGGLDCTASLIEHRRAVRALFTVWGADVQLSDPQLWRALNDTFDDNPLLDGIERISARTNMRRFPIAHTLVHDFLAAGDSWWGRVQHGLALAGLAAPASVALGTSSLIRAASFSADSNQATGSMPQLDALTRWAGVVVRHEGFELTRQQKVSERLGPYLATGGRARLAVCYQRGRHDGAGGVNCGTCEKCLRTAGGLLAAGIEPLQVGLVVPSESYQAWTARLSAGLPLPAHTLPFWQETRAALNRGTPEPADPAAAAFLLALADAGSLLPAQVRVDRLRYLRRYWAKRREARWLQVRESLDAAGQRTRRRVAALIR